MFMKLLFKLTGVAKSNGGDRYEHGTKGQGEYMVFYIPQTVSREEGEIKKELTITIE